MLTALQGNFGIVGFTVYNIIFTNSDCDWREMIVLFSDEGSN
jgi:hypothetical protein